VLRPPDIDECEQPCGPDAECVNTLGSYACVCNRGFALRSGRTNYTGNKERCKGKAFVIFHL